MARKVGKQEGLLYGCESLGGGLLPGHVSRSEKQSGLGRWQVITCKVFSQSVPSSHVPCPKESTATKNSADQRVLKQPK